MGHRNPESRQAAEPGFSVDAPRRIVYGDVLKGKAMGRSFVVSPHVGATGRSPNHHGDSVELLVARVEDEPHGDGL
jgi:hypothetical protein